MSERSPRHPSSPTQAEANMKETGGEPVSSNDLPSAETIRETANYILLDNNGRTHTFQSLYSGHNVAHRVLVVFVRHFFCGNCKEFLRSLSETVTPEALLGLPISTFITIVGCGNPALIDGYVESTNCPFPVYTDPSGGLFQHLGMTMTLALGTRPAYMRKNMLQSISESFFEALRWVPSGMALKSGDHRQIGGKFLFEPLKVASPDPQMALNFSHDEQMDDAPVEPKRVTWCHRMTTTRDHAEIPELMDILGLDSPAEPTDKKDRKRWTQAMQMRKGSGATMAEDMRRLSGSDRSHP